MAITRDQAVEGVGNLQVEHATGLVGILAEFSWDTDTCRVLLDGPDTELRAPRLSWSVPRLSQRKGGDGLYPQGDRSRPESITLRIDGRVVAEQVARILGRRSSAAG